MKNSTRSLPADQQKISGELFPEVGDTSEASAHGSATKRKTRMAPVVTQIELFTPNVDVADLPLKGDMASMDVPLYSLSKNADTEVREYKRGNRTVRIIPSSVGAATIFDQDLIFYLASVIVEAINNREPISRTIHVDSWDFIRFADRDDSRGGFEGLVGLLRRTRGTTIETNIPTGGTVQTSGFSLIDDYRIISEKKRYDRKLKKDVSRVLSFTVTLSEWLYNGLVNLDVLTLNRAYFSLSKAIERKLYEVARKHCGTDKAVFEINIDLLAEKCGFKGERFKFREELRSIIKAESLPDYRIALDTRRLPDMVVFYTRSEQALSKYIRSEGRFEWWEGLERAPKKAA